MVSRGIKQSLAEALVGGFLLLSRCLFRQGLLEPKLALNLRSLCVGLCHHADFEALFLNNVFNYFLRISYMYIVHFNRVHPVLSLHPIPNPPTQGGYN